LQPVSIVISQSPIAWAEIPTPWVSALADNRSGLQRCDFADAVLDTYIGRVPELETVRVREDLSAYDCRNNRLAQWAIEQDEFGQKVAAARKKYGANRIGVFLVPAPPASTRLNSLIVGVMRKPGRSRPISDM
jgi:hypothetical protein